MRMRMRVRVHVSWQDKCNVLACVLWIHLCKNTRQKIQLHATFLFCRHFSSNIYNYWAFSGDSAFVWDWHRRYTCHPIKWSKGNVKSSGKECVGEIDPQEMTTMRRKEWKGRFYGATRRAKERKKELPERQPLFFFVNIFMCHFEHKDELHTPTTTPKDNPCNSIISILNDSKEILHTFLLPHFYVFMRLNWFVWASWLFLFFLSFVAQWINKTSMSIFKKPNNLPCMRFFPSISLSIDFYFVLNLSRLCHNISMPFVL